MPCSNCHRNGRSCIIDIDPLISNSCSECARRNLSCDGVDVGAQRGGDKLLREIMELQSRLLRTREQKRHLQKRQKELFDRGVVEHDKEVRELEASESYEEH
ncbi:hypothetical protein N0V85_000286 [Neurospora sp. IMI 360204]|nr:hypothetical protein N0V85_000286 [Neurospora sp. IMI 360204]